MLYHPDRNPSPEAEDMFIQINEAYDGLMEGRERRMRQSSPINRRKASPYEGMSREELLKQRRERAKRNAERKYEKFVEECKEFQKSLWYYPARLLVLLLYLFVLAFIGFVSLGLYFAIEDGPAVGIVFGIFLVPMMYVGYIGLRNLIDELEPYFEDYD